MAASTVSAGSEIRRLASIGGTANTAATRVVKGTCRYLLLINRTNNTEGYMGMYYLYTYLRTGSNASGNKAGLLEIKKPTSGLTSLTVTASTSDDTATVTYTPSASSCYCMFIRIS